MISFRNSAWRYTDLIQWKKIWYQLYEELGWRWEWNNGDQMLIVSDIPTKGDIRYYDINTDGIDLDGAVPLPPSSVLLVMAQRLSETRLEKKLAPDMIHMASKQLLDSWCRLKKEEN
jgi:hypothetical protein